MSVNLGSADCNVVPSNMTLSPMEDLAERDDAIQKYYMIFLGCLFEVPWQAQWNSIVPTWLSISYKDPSLIEPRMKLMRRLKEGVEVFLTIEKAHRVAIQTFNNRMKKTYRSATFHINTSLAKELSDRECRHRGFEDIDAPCESTDAYEKAFQDVVYLGAKLRRCQENILNKKVQIDDYYAAVSLDKPPLKYFITLLNEASRRWIYTGPEARGAEPHRTNPSIRSITEEQKKVQDFWQDKAPFLAQCLDMNEKGPPVVLSEEALRVSRAYEKPFPIMPSIREYKQLEKDREDAINEIKSAFKRYQVSYEIHRKDRIR